MIILRHKNFSAWDDPNDPGYKLLHNRYDNVKPGTFGKDTYNNPERTTKYLDSFNDSIGRDEDDDELIDDYVRGPYTEEELQNWENQAGYALPYREEYLDARRIHRKDYRNPKTGFEYSRSWMDFRNDADDEELGNIARELGIKKVNSKDGIISNYAVKDATFHPDNMNMSKEEYQNKYNRFADLWYKKHNPVDYEIGQLHKECGVKSVNIQSNGRGGGNINFEYNKDQATPEQALKTMRLMELYRQKYFPRGNQ